MINFGGDRVPVTSLRSACGTARTGGHPPYPSGNFSRFSGLPTTS
jgi:hypothetical protein